MGSDLSSAPKVFLREATGLTKNVSLFDAIAIDVCWRRPQFGRSYDAIIANCSWRKSRIWLDDRCRFGCTADDCVYYDLEEYL
jgi:hypothetical protein